MQDVSSDGALRCGQSEAITFLNSLIVEFDLLLSGKRIKGKPSFLMKPATLGHLLRNTRRENQRWDFALSTHEQRREVRWRGLGARDFFASYFLANVRPARFFWSFSSKEKDKRFVVEDKVSSHQNSLPDNSAFDLLIC